MLAFLKVPRTSTELGKHLGITSGMALYHLNRLRLRNRVTREGAGKRTRWMATKPTT